jgi:hypothetical protein
MATRVVFDGAQRNYNLRTLQRAKKTLGLTSIRVGGLGSDGDWMWADPKRLNQGQSMTQELNDKLDRREKQVAEAAVTSKAQSRARIINGWLGDITEEMFGQGKTLAEIRVLAARQNPYLTNADLAQIEEEFGMTASSRLRELDKAKATAEEAYETVRKTQNNLLIARKITAAQVKAEIDKAEIAVKKAQDQLDLLSKQIGPTMVHKLRMGQQTA